LADSSKKIFEISTEIIVNIEDADVLKKTITFQATALDDYLDTSKLLVVLSC
jgi:hypothetical protein